MQPPTEQESYHAPIDLHAAIASLRAKDPDWRGATSRVHAYKRRQQHTYVTRSADIPPDCVPHSIEYQLARAVTLSERSEARVTALAVRLGQVAGEKRTEAPARQVPNGKTTQTTQRLPGVSREFA